MGATVGPHPIDQAWFTWVHILSSTWCQAGAGPGLHPQRCMWGCVTWGDSSCASDYILPFKNNCDLEPRGEALQPLPPGPGGHFLEVGVLSGLVTVATAAAVIALRGCPWGSGCSQARDVVSYCRIDLGSTRVSGPGDCTRLRGLSGRCQKSVAPF